MRLFLLAALLCTWSCQEPELPSGYAHGISTTEWALGPIARESERHAHDLLELRAIWEEYFVEAAAAGENVDTVPSLDLQQRMESWRKRVNTQDVEIWGHAGVLDDDWYYTGDLLDLAKSGFLQDKSTLLFIADSGRYCWNHFAGDWSESYCQITWQFVPPTQGEGDFSWNHSPWAAVPGRVLRSLQQAIRFEKEAPGKFAIFLYTDLNDLGEDDWISLERGIRACQRLVEQGTSNPIAIQKALQEPALANTARHYRRLFGEEEW